MLPRLCTGFKPSSGIVGGTAMLLNAVKPSATAGSREIGEALRVVHGRFVKVFHPPAAEVAVSADVIAHRPAPELRQRQPGDLADDVPQGEVDAGDGGGAHDAVPVPEVLAIHHLPEMLRPRRVLADEQLRDVFDRADDAARVPFERGLAPAEQAGLVGDDLHEHPVPHPGVADERFDFFDFH